MKFALSICAGLVMAMCLAPDVRAQVLVTQEEAALPPAKGAIAVSTRGITRGPKVAFMPQGVDIRSPTMFAVKFESFGGATIDLESVKVTYLRSPTVDLTPRIRPFLLPTGIMMPNAELPPGDHSFRVDLADSGGRAATTSFVVKVAP